MSRQSTSQDKRLYPLASCSIGIWRTPGLFKCYLLVLQDRKEFVILLTREVDARGGQQDKALSVNGLLARIRNSTSLWLRHKNPFVDHTQQPDKDTSILTFEIKWSNIVGIDFKWPLTEDARLVLEAAHMAKRVFNTVEDVCLYYQPGPKSSSSRRSRVSALDQLAAATAAADEQQQQAQGQEVSSMPAPAQMTNSAATSGTAAAAAGAGPNSGHGGAGCSSPDTATAKQLGLTNKLHAAVVACDVGPAAGSMSRVSSWTSWASWTSGRSSLEQQQQQQPAAADLNAAVAAAVAAQAKATTQEHRRQHHQQQGKQERQQQQQQQQQCMMPCACDGLRVAGSQQQQPWQQQRSSCDHADQQLSLPTAPLSTAPTLSAGIAPGSLVEAADAAAAADAANAAPEGSSAGGLHAAAVGQCKGGHERGSSWDFFTAHAAAVPAAPGLSQHDGAGAAAGTGAGNAAAEAGVGTEAVLWPLHIQAVPIPVPEAPAADTTGAATVAAAAAATAADSDASLLDSPVEFPRSYDSIAACWPQRLRLLNAGCATAPCSMPSSPKVSAQHEEQQQLLLDVEQRMQQLYEQQQQEQQQQVQERKQKRSGNSSSSTSNRQRQASADRACPLCNQPLLQPLHVLQQGFHQQQQLRAGRSRSGRSALGKSRSACSLEQLAQQARTAAAASSSSNGNKQQQEAGEAAGAQHGQQQQQQQTAAKFIAGMAAAAVGGLAACCVEVGRQGVAAGSAAVRDIRSAAGGGAAGAANGTDTKPHLHHHQQQQKQQQKGSCKQAGEGVDAAATADSATEGAAAVQDALAPPMQPVEEAAAAAAAAASNAADAVQAAAEDKPSPAVAATGAAGLHGAAAAAGSSGAGSSSSSTAAASVPTSAAAAAAGVGVDQAITYSCRTVVLTFKDPTLPHQLKKFVNADVRLLKLYESGLPGWAVLLPSYGLWYRPWLRRVTWLLFVLLSVVSMAMGFYDLYKNVPYFKTFMVAMFRPAAAVFEWLEGHTQIRLSILLTYMLGKSQLLMQLIKLLTHTSLQPIIAPIAALLAPLATAVSAAAATLRWLCTPFTALARVLLGPLGHLVLLLLQMVWQLLSVLLWSGPLQLLGAIGEALLAVVQLVLLPLQALLPGAASLRAGWSAAKATGQMAKSAVPVVKGAASATRSSWSMWGWSMWSPLEALELMRVSAMRIARSLQAVVKFFVTLGSTVNQHRLSLMLQLRAQLRGGLRAAAHSPAGRVASAVAVKMGQEERVQRLQRRLARSDSCLISTGSILGPADSAAVGTALSLEGELSMGLLDDLGRAGSFTKEADADSDDEVTSGVTAAPVSPAQLYSSAGGLRYRGPGDAAAGTRGAADAAAVGFARPVGAITGSSNSKGVAAGWQGKQVTFATTAQQGQQQFLQAGLESPGSSSSHYIRPGLTQHSSFQRRSIDAVTAARAAAAAAASAAGWHGSVAAADGQMERTDEAAAAAAAEQMMMMVLQRYTEGGRSGSSLGGDRPDSSSSMRGGVNGPTWHSSVAVADVEASQMSRSYDIGSQFSAAGQMQQQFFQQLRLQQQGEILAADSSSSSSVSRLLGKAGGTVGGDGSSSCQGVAAAVIVSRPRRNSWG